MEENMNVVRYLELRCNYILLLNAHRADYSSFFYYNY